MVWALYFFAILPLSFVFSTRKIAEKGFSGVSGLQRTLASHGFPARQPTEGVVLNTEPPGLSLATACPLGWIRGGQGNLGVSRQFGIFIGAAYGQRFFLPSGAGALSDSTGGRTRMPQLVISAIFLVEKKFLAVIATQFSQ